MSEEHESSLLTDPVEIYAASLQHLTIAFLFFPPHVPEQVWKKVRHLNAETPHIKVSSIAREIEMPAVEHIVCISAYVCVRVLTHYFA